MRLKKRQEGSYDDEARLMGWTGAAEALEGCFPAGVWARMCRNVSSESGVECETGAADG